MINRREFVGGVMSGLAATGIARAARSQPAQPETDKKLGFAFVGLGSYATRQMMPAVAACNHVRIAALVSGSPDKAKRLAAQYAVDPKNIYTYETFDALKDNPEVDVIYIVLPVSMHAEYVIRAAKAGKHVMCEKPMASTSAECAQMIEACKTANKKLMIGYRCHHEPFNLEAIRIIREKELGDLRQIDTDMGFPLGDPNAWRLNKKLAGGGPIYDIGIYGLNACRYLTGEEPTEVTATMYTLPNDPRFATVEASCNFTLKFPSGVLAANSTSYDYASQNRIRCIFTKGSFEMDPATSYNNLKLTLKGGPNPGERKIQEINQFATEMDHLAECILTNKEVKSPGEEGMRDIRIIETVYEAARTGKSVKL